MNRPVTLPWEVVEEIREHLTSIDRHAELMQERIGMSGDDKSDLTEIRGRVSEIGNALEEWGGR